VSSWAGPSASLRAEPFGRSVPSAPRRAGRFAFPLVHQALIVATIAVLAAPAVTPAAGLERHLFPVAVTLVAGWLAVRGRFAAYVTFCLWLFFLTPFVRRLVDLHAGYAQANDLMLAPYLALAWSVGALPQFFLSRGGRAQWPFAAVFAAIFYGFAVAFTQGRVFPAMLDLLRWAMPPLLACAIIARGAADPEGWRRLCSELRALTLLALPLLGLYGLYQFVAAPAWDVAWMRNTDMPSIGLPYPFQIRVFGTMNSPASLAYFLEALILIGLTLRSPLRWGSMGLGAAALAVSLVRSAWVGLALGLALLPLVAPTRVRASFLILLAGAMVLSPVALSSPRVQKLVADRVHTLTDLRTDKSLTERSQAYSEAVDELSLQPWGEGLGIANVAANYTNRQRLIDGGLIEVGLSLGVVAGLVYFGAVAALLIVALIRPVFGDDGGITSATRVIALVQTLTLASVNSLTGEIGMIFWTSVAVIIAAPRQDQRPELVFQGRRGVAGSSKVAQLRHFDPI